ncbi:Eukaryotic translation initiation factor isoform 4G-2 [Zea mays]|nr:Eukaryotic translation initiation factor isoform 4G-2 [Zea mays]
MEEILKKMEDTMYRKAVFDAVKKTLEANPSGQTILGSHAAVIDACNSLLE